MKKSYICFQNYPDANLFHSHGLNVINIVQKRRWLGIKCGFPLGDKSRVTRQSIVKVE